MSDSNDELEELRQQTQTQNRLNDRSEEENTSSETESQTDNQPESNTSDMDSSTENKQPRLTEDIKTELDEIARNGQNKTVSIWDGEIAALLAVLDERPEERQRVIESLQEQLGVYADGSSDRAEILKMLLRVGLTETDPELADSLQEAMKKHAAQTL